MNKNLVETILGAVVLAVAGGFLMFFYKTTDIRPTTGYTIIANFSKIDGLDTGSPVKVNGIKVGQVLDFSLDEQTYMPAVRMNINKDVKLPIDTSANIVSAGLLDGRYVSLLPGAEEETMKDGEKIRGDYAPGFEELIGKAIYGLTNKTDDKKSAAAPAKASAHP